MLKQGNFIMEMNQKTKVCIKKATQFLVIQLLFLQFAIAQNYTYTFYPSIGTYTDCGSGTDDYRSISYSNCQFTTGTTFYSLGHFRVAVTSFNPNTGQLGISVKKCNGYFNNGNTFKIFVGDSPCGDIFECRSFTIYNSTTDRVQFTMTIPWMNYQGVRTLRFFLITSDQVYKQYGGSIDIVCSPSSNNNQCHCASNTTLTAMSGTFSDGSGTSDYGHNSDCKWVIQPSGATSISLNFSSFETEDGYDFVDIYDGSSTSSPLLASYSGQISPASVTSTGGSMLVHFHTDGSVSSTGWTAHYTSSTTSGCYCSANTTLTSPSGTFSDGSGSNSYNDNSDCNWLIMPPSATSISLSFSDFDTEGGWDYVEIHDGTSSSAPLLATYSGHNLNPADVTSSGGAMLVHFHSDGSVVGNGWTAQYTSSTVPSGCTWSDCTSGSCGNATYLTAAQKMAAIQYLCQHNIIDNGTGSSPFRPDDYITRAELAKMAFYGLYDGYPNVPDAPNLISDYISSPYTDLQDPGTYYYRAAKCLMYLQYHDDNGGITPFDRDQAYFNPGGTLSRKLVLKVLLETYDIAPYNGYSTSTPFSDYDASDSFWKYAKEAYTLGITNTSLFRPNDNCTRAEAAVFLYRILTNPNITIPTPVNSANPAISDFFIPNNLSPEALSAIGGIEYGNYKYYSKDCFSYPGWISMDFGFSYNSYITEMPSDYYPLTPLAHRAWNHTYNMYMNVISDPYSGHDYLLFHLSGGNILMYEKNGNSLTKKTEGDYNTVSANGTTIYTLTTPNQVVYTFEKLVGSKPVYYLRSIHNRFGDGIDINYQPSVATGYRRISSVVSGTGNAERTLQFAYYAGSDNISSVTDTKNRMVHFHYSNGNLHQFTDAKNQTTTYNYGTLNMEKDLLKSVQMPNGNTVHNEYAQRKLTSTRTNNNTATTITQSISQSNNEITYNTTVTEPVRANQNLVTHHIINSMGKITRVYDNCNVDMTINYTNNVHKTLPSSVVDNKTGITTSYSYTNSGCVNHRVTSASGLSKVESWAYNSYNDITDYTDANNNTTHYTYTPLGALSEVRDDLNRITSITNNSHGKPTTVHTPAGITYNYTYTNRGLLSQLSVSGTGLSQSFTYDVVGRKTQETNNGNTTQFAYDNNDNLTEITDALNHTTTMIYDANDNLTQITNALGYATVLTYDNNDLCTSQSYRGHSKYFTYNTDGSLRTFVSPNGQTRTFTYNNSGNITSDGYASYSYLDNGLIGSVSKDNKAITYGYDALARVTSVTYDNKTVTYTYDNADNIISIGYPDNRTVTYTYDAANRMTSVKDWNNHSIFYSYRDDNQLNYVQYPNNVRTTFSYDNAGRRTGQVTKRNNGNGTVIAQYTYTLDGNGNHESENIIEPYTTFPSPDSQIFTYHYGNDNRLTQAGSTMFGYDNNGNTTSKSGRTMTYDICDNLTSVSGNYNASFTYDGLGHRRSSTRNGSTTKYVLDILRGDAHVLMETNNAGAAQHYYIYGADGLVSRIGADGSTTHYYIYDHRGSTVAIVNSSTAADITHKYQYGDFGQILQSEELDSNPFRYVGKYGLMYETEDLYFVRARYYDPTIGRFLSEDPIWRSTNSYSYVGNNPIVDIDPSGRISLLEIGRLAIKTMAGGGGHVSKSASDVTIDLIKQLLYRNLDNTSGKQALSKKTEPIKRALCKVLPSAETCKNDPPEETRRQLDQEFAWQKTNDHAEAQWKINHELFNDLRNEFAWQNLDIPSKMVVVGAGVGLMVLGAPIIAPVIVSSLNAIPVIAPPAIYLLAY